MQFHYEYQNFCHSSEILQWYRKHANEKKQVFKKKQEDIILNTILYCSTAGCAEAFHEASKLEEYILSGKCSIPEDISFDQVKKSFTYRMKFTL